MPRNASINGDGFRFYRFEPDQSPENIAALKAAGVTGAALTEPTDVLSVTSIRTLAGEPFQLVAWKVSNVVNLAMGVRKQTRIGPRGGVKEVYVKDGVFPGEFVARMLETRGAEESLDILRRWLRETADEPRDIAAVRGSVVHKMIELNVKLPRISEDSIRARFEAQWNEERRKVKPDVTAEDVRFAHNAMRQYWDMRAHVPFVIIAQEPQVWNLEAGYAGSTDVLLWFLPEGSTDADVAYWQKRADAGKLTVEDVEKTGGELVLGDWKTSKGVYTNHVIQATAYMGAQFVGRDGIVNTRLTELLDATVTGMLIHIRPNKWEVDLFDFRPDVLRAFLGSVAFARFLALHKTPTELFTRTMSGTAEGTDDSQEITDDAA